MDENTHMSTIIFLIHFSGYDEGMFEKLTIKLWCHSYTDLACKFVKELCIQYILRGIVIIDEYTRFDRSELGTYRIPNVHLSTY